MRRSIQSTVFTLEASLAELEGELKILCNPNDDEARMIDFIGTPVGQRIAETQLRINWRRNRISPPKCLQCGLSDIVPVPTDGEFQHPQTGERVVVASSGWMSTDQWHAEFTPEGDVISSTYT